MAVKDSTKKSIASKAVREPKGERSSGTDAFVVLAMTLTTVALAIGLYLQFRLAFWLAVVAALSVYVGLLALHALVRRSERVEQLSGEVERLKAELEQAHGQVQERAQGQVHVQAQGRAWAGPGSSASPSAGSTLAGQVSVTANGPGLSPPAAVQSNAAPARGMPAAPMTGAETAPAAGTSTANSSDPEPPSGPLAPAASGRKNMPGPLPPSTPATPAVAASLRDAGMAAMEPRAQTAAAAMAPPPLPVAQRPAPGLAASTPQPEHTRTSQRAGSTPVGSPAGSKDVMGDYWAYRPQPSPLLRDAPAAQRPLDGGAAALPPFERPAMSPPRVPAPVPGAPLTAAGSQPELHGASRSPPPLPPVSVGKTGPAMPTASSSEHQIPAPARSTSPREADVEMIQGLIKKLADEVNAAEASLLVKPAGAPRVPASAIEASVNALRTTADTMRAPAQTAAFKPAASQPAAAVPAASRPASAPISAAESGASKFHGGAKVRRDEPPKPDVAASRIDPFSVPEYVASGQAGQGPASQGPGSQGPATDGRGVQASPGKGSSSERSSMSRKPAPHVPAAMPSAAIPPTLAPPPMPSRVVDMDALPPAPAVIEDQSLPPWNDHTAGDIDGSEDAQQIQVASPATATGTYAHSKLAALAEAITAGRLDVLLEPILGLADQRARHFEVSVRLKDKNRQVLDPPESVPELRDSGLLPLLDCARIGRSAQVARRLADRGKAGSLFSAFSGEALGHDQFLADFTEAYVAREALAEQLVLTFAQADVRGFAGRDWDTVAEMRELGFRFSLQSVTDLDMDFEALKLAGFDFVKLDSGVFLDGMPASGGVIPPADICRHLAQLGMTLIVGQIDDEAHLARIFGFGVIYGQGQLFGGARSMKAEALGGATNAAA